MDWSVAERVELSPALLSSEELLSVLGITGAIDQIINALDSKPSMDALCAIPGVGKASARKLLAALELGQRNTKPRKRRISMPADVLPECHDIRAEEQEHMVVFSLNGAHEVICRHTVSIGTVNRTLVHPREIFRRAIKENAAAVIMVHNHPSGSTEPSPDDFSVTNRVYTAGETLGISLLDHIVVSETSYYSMLEHDRLKGD